MKKIFITGASSFLSGSLVDILKNRYDITLLEHKKALYSKDGDEIKIVQGSLENVEEWGKAIFETDIIIHLAGVTHPKNIGLYKKINTDGTSALVSVSEKYRVKQFIFISTSAVGKNCGAYGKSKMEAEVILKRSKVPYTILRVGPSYSDNFEGKEGLASLVKLARKSPILPYLTDNNIKFIKNKPHNKHRRKFNILWSFKNNY